MSFPTFPSPREALASKLSEIITYDFAWGDTGFDLLSKPVFLLKQESFSRLPAAPLAFHLVNFVITIVSPLEDRGKAEDSLDGLVNAFIHDIDAAGIPWTTAEKVQYDGRYVAYDINVQLESLKEEDHS